MGRGLTLKFSCGALCPRENMRVPRLTCQAPTSQFCGRRLLQRYVSPPCERPLLREEGTTSTRRLAAGATGLGATSSTSARRPLAQARGTSAQRLSRDP
jgi:hypothetical protein